MPRPSVIAKPGENQAPSDGPRPARGTAAKIATDAGNRGAAEGDSSEVDGNAPSKHGGRIHTVGHPELMLPPASPGRSHRSRSQSRSKDSREPVVHPSSFPPADTFPSTSGGIIDSEDGPSDPPEITNWSASAPLTTSEPPGLRAEKIQPRGKPDPSRQGRFLLHV